MRREASVATLNWYGADERLTKGLRQKLKDERTIVTMRLGSKWADKFNPDDIVDISISDDPENPNVIGQAKIRTVKKTTIRRLTSEDLRYNIGAKDIGQVAEDMDSVYPEDVDVYSTVSVIEFDSTI